ncbi:acid-shock protein [Paraburkholderia sp. RG36]|uniref:Acid-shock protein n=2 Tax=Paraburkholderia tagetis TaxID=2913261 RepID=A0A9X1RSB1_9BURK|nr:acid-shock protein [Paraburkholderia tagetis]MCG5077326.1 acid-shock protein [Paraburkholderia tagetis]
MKKLMLMLTAFGVAALAQPSFAQQPAAVHQEASDVSSYSAPTQKHVKKPKKKKAKKGEAAASAAEPAAASQ